MWRAPFVLIKVSNWYRSAKHEERGQWDGSRTERTEREEEEDEGGSNFEKDDGAKIRSSVVVRALFKLSHFFNLSSSLVPILMQLHASRRK